MVIHISMKIKIAFMKFRIWIHGKKRHVLRYTHTPESMPEGYVGIVDNLDGTYDVYTYRERSNGVECRGRKCTEYEAYRIALSYI